MIKLNTLIKNVIICVAAATALTSCRGNGCSRGPGSTAQPQALESITLPLPFVAVGGSNNVNEMVSQLSAFANHFSPVGEGLKNVMHEGLSKTMALRDLSAVDLTKPLRFAMIDPEKYGERSLVLLASITQKDAFVRTLASGGKENEQKNDVASLNADGGPRYYNFIDSTVVVTPVPELFSLHREFLTKLAASTLRDSLSVTFSFVNINNLYGKQIAAKLQEIQSQAMQDATFVDTLWIANSIRELSQVNGVLDLQGGDLKLSWEAHPLAGSALEKHFGNLEGVKSKLLARMPKSTSIWLAVAMKGTEAQPLLNSLLHQGLSSQKTAELAQRYGKVLQQLAAVTDGEFVGGVHDAGKSEVAISGLFGLSDEAEGKKAFDGLLDLYADPDVATRMKPEGVALKTKRNAYSIKDVSVAVTEVAVDSRRSGGMPFSLSDVLTNHVAVSKDVGVYTFGSGAKSAMTMFLDPHDHQPLDRAPGVVRSMNNAAKGAFGWLYISPTRVAKHVMHFLGSDFPLPSNDNESGIMLSVGANSGVLRAVVDFPAAAAKTIGGLVGGFLPH